jgi:tetraacyldisaccharide 4'-kinase
MMKNNGFKIIKDIEFPDHYIYSNKDIEKILVIAKSLNCQVLTTEKDYLRLTVKDLNQINYIKSELKITNEENFINSVLLNEIY